MSDFLNKLEKKVKQQLVSQRVGFLLGAGSAYLNRNGYPLATELWDLINSHIPATERTDIQRKLDDGANGLEQALDLLDNGGAKETPHRHSVTKAIAEYFMTLKPPLETHSEFLSRLSKRTEPMIPIFSLNYDPLIERTAEYKKIYLIDGFQGMEQAYFIPAIFQKRIGLVQKGYRGLQWRLDTGIIHLFKLHGSLGWYECPSNGIRRCNFSSSVPSNTKRLMIPPQYRKATDTMTLPYSSLWSEFRGMLRQGPFLINRLVSIGYGMCDEHVNAVIENGLARADFTLIIFAMILKPEVFQRWSTKNNVIIVTKDQCSLNGEIGPGHLNLWDFEKLSQEV
jgi:hypothetical protein